MARVIFSPLISAMSGKTADAVFASWKGIAYVRQHVIPANPRTDAQMAVRYALAECVAIWQALSTLICAAYDAGADELSISGYNDFVGRNRAPLQALTGLFGPRRNLDAVEPRIQIPIDWAYDNEPGAGTAEYTWTDTLQGADYRMGFMIYDTATNLLGDVNINANPLSAESQVLSHPNVGTTYLVAAWVYRVSDGELVHFGSSAHEQLT